VGKNTDEKRITITLSAVQYAELLTAVDREQRKTPHRVTASTYVKALVLDALNDSAAEA